MLSGKWRPFCHGLSVLSPMSLSCWVSSPSQPWVPVVIMCANSVAAVAQAAIQQAQAAKGYQKTVGFGRPSNLLIAW